MFDLAFLPDSSRVRVWQFIGQATGLLASGGEWQTWAKPPGISMVWITAIGSGGGGGAGFSRIAGANGGGGGGGGGGNIAHCLVPAWVLPDILYIQAFAGGAGAAPGTGFANGGLSASVTVNPVANTFSNGSDFVLTTGDQTGPAGGASGISTNGGSSGFGDTPFSGGRALAGIANFTSGGGGSQGGNGGTNNQNGTSITISGVTAVVPGGGAGGAGAATGNFVGGGFTIAADSYLTDINPPLPAAGSNYGSGGITLWKPFYGFGGQGGSSNNTGVGGAGGPGGIGAGGGGGGAGTTGGRGGDGGAGLVVIMAW